MDADRTTRLERLALHRPELRAWALYDCANSGVYTVIVSAVFPIFFARVPAAELAQDEQRRWFAATTTACLVVAALIGPVLGAIADFKRRKKAFLALSAGLGILSTAAMFTLGAGDWKAALWLFALANLGVVASLVFYDSLLPHIARGDEADRLSSSGYALGYLGGGLCLALCVLLILRPGAFGLPTGEGLAPAAASLPTRVGFLVVAVWWLAFSLPLFLRVREPPAAIEPDESAGDNSLRIAFARLRETFGELRAYRQAFLVMIAFFVYGDAIGTIIRMAAIFGQERGIDPTVMLGCFVLAQFVGVPFTLLFGRLAGAIGVKRAILVALAAYVGICAFAYGMDSQRDFIVLAVGVGMVQGGAQALSRSLFASLIPRHKSAEFFGLYATFEKFAGIVGPVLFSVGPSSGAAILALVAFFVIGGWLLARVDVEAGRRTAQAAEAQQQGS